MARLGSAADDVLRVTSPALGSEQFEAKVHFVGREVEPTTNAIPVVGKITNDGKLRPGLFVKLKWRLVPS